MAAKPDAPDWERIEVAYRANVQSLREIAAEHGITEGAIRKRAKRDAWERDLSAKVRAKADALVRKDAVRKEVRKETPTEREVVEVEAKVQARIRLAHRQDIARSRAIAMKLLAELEHQTDHGDAYEQLFDLLHDVDADDDKAKDRVRKLQEAFQRAMSLSGRTDTMKKLAETLRILIDKEREAFGIGTEAGEAPDAAEALRGFFEHLHNGAGRLPIVR